ncbi:hypothetical protein [Bacteroides sp. 224]|uniref:hypothetical protein n=1 Tax=Bacteroides sp. 224 TaxID=2302936 RepID=UPI0013D45BAD|nr:hypothetical protein [Bacteroides sp. 224]NDV66409.1 hypothetical protein [Bacteroides sp. 224]
MVRVKHFKTFLAFAALTLGLSFYSCSSDDDGPDDSTTNAPLVGKWEVSNQNAEYGSFEFTGDQKYIITQRTTIPTEGSRSVTRAGETYIIVIFGDYSTKSTEGNEYKLDLKEFGTIVISITESGATITVNGEMYDVSKAPEVAITDRTKLLCHTWNLDKAREYVPSDEEAPEYIFIGNGETITFTNNGTYVQYNANLTEEQKEYDGIPDYEYGTWKWIDSKTLEMSYNGYLSGHRVETRLARYTVTEFTNNKLTLECIVEFEPEEYDPEDEYTMWLSR